MNVTREILEGAYSVVRHWLSKPNIVGLYVDKKRVDGRETDDWAFIVHVIKKKSPSELASYDFPIPKELEIHIPTEGGSYQSLTVLTDVIESGPMELHSLNTKVRPCPGGYRIQASNFARPGTLGVNMVWRNKYRLLTCNHVIAKNGNRNKRVWQPTNDLGYSLTKVTGWVPVTTYSDENQHNPKYNTQDLAWCDITPRKGAPEIHSLGIPAGLRSPILGESVLMMGQKTGVMQRARIASITFNSKVTFKADDPKEYAWFKELIKLDAPISQPGDSGAAYLAEIDNKIVGIHMGGGQNNGFGCRLKD